MNLNLQIYFNNYVYIKLLYKYAIHAIYAIYYIIYIVYLVLYRIIY